MHRFFLILICFIIVQSVFAGDFMPNYINPYAYYGTGLINVSGKTVIYEENNTNSKPKAVIDKDKIKIENIAPAVENVYIALNKEKDIALLPVKEDTDEWFYVCYEQKRKLFGWVKKADNIDYMSWHDFFNLYGRKYGIYLFRNLKDKHKKLYSAPSTESTVVDNFYFPKHVSLWLIGGDWMLVKVTTYDGITKTGWMKWRLENGALLSFPDLKEY